MDEKNKLYFGDNLKMLREYVPDASVDLVYLDPPFNSSAIYNVLFKEKSGDHPLVPSLLRRGNRGGWQLWGMESEAVYKEIVTSGPHHVAIPRKRFARRMYSMAGRCAGSGGRKTVPRETRNASTPQCDRGAVAPLYERRR